MPAPPIRFKPKAPDLGIFSDTKPSMVGQKKQTPIPKMIAAKNIISPVMVLNRYNPSAASMVDISNTIWGEKRLSTGLAKARPTTITPVSSVNNNSALLVTFFNNTSSHWPVNSSVIAVPNMQMNMNKNNGDATALYIPAVDTPEATRSVTGK